MSNAASRLQGMRLLSTVINKESHWKIKILNRWAAIAGEFAARLVVNKIEEDTLFLEASHPMWAQEAQGSTHLFLEKIDGLCGPGRITKIVVRGCKSARTQRNPDSSKQEPTQRTLFSELNEPASVELTPAERNALKAISHKKLSKSMAEFYQQCKRRSLVALKDRDLGRESNGICRRTDCRCTQPHAARTPTQTS